MSEIREAWEITCSSMGCEGVPATRYVSWEGEGGHPYCASCADFLVRCGDIDRGPVEEAEVEANE